MISSKFVKSCEQGNNGEKFFNIFLFILSIVHIEKAHKARVITLGSLGWTVLPFAGLYVHAVVAPHECTWHSQVGFKRFAAEA